MSHASAMRQIGAKNVGFKIEIMKWSNRMDLLAVSNDKGEVIVQRLNWQKIWTHAPPSDGVKVRGIDWRPDEKIIAIGYSTGLVVLLDIENQHEINSFKLGGDITCLGWTQNTKEIIDDAIDSQENPLNSHETFLPQLPSFNSLSLTARKTDYTSTKSYSKNILNLLIVGLKSGVLHTSVFGVLPCGNIEISKHINIPADQFEITDAKMSADFKQVFVFIKLENMLRLLIFENEIFPMYSLPLLNLAIKHGYILNTMAYIEDIIQCITEAWEVVLMEMDNKLTKYANSQPEGAVSADFLELLMFGYPSDSLELFLTRDLTEKGLKKLGNSIEISYATIQKLVIKPLHSGILNICFHLNSIKGMSRNTYFYKPLLRTLSNDAILNAGAFLIKSLELQQTIQQSTRDYKIFWCWLFSVIIRLMDETVPDDIAAVSQQDIMYLAEFLNTFDQSENNDATGTPKKRFNLERVGQYLENKNLQIPTKTDFTQKWHQLLEENECLKNCEVIYPHHKHLSLIQQHNLLKTSIAELFSKPEKLIGDDFKLKTYIDCANLSGTKSIFTTHVNIESENISMFAGLISRKLLFFIEINPKLESIAAIKYEFQHKPYFDEKLNSFGDLNFRHIQFYNEDILSVLLHNAIEFRSSNCFVQFPVAMLKTKLQKLRQNDVIDISKYVPISNLYETIDSSLIRTIDGFEGYILSVSGSRKVASLLSESKKRIRLYEMEVEEDDEELDTSQNNSLDVSKESNHSQKL